jgi:crotonobetainyl-CoA:carnitine CoA-transferase CaiB-like acyl-CoA transferase
VLAWFFQESLSCLSGEKQTEDWNVKPLQHLTILDLSRVLACPFASMILAELGATVIKVEQPGAGDETRGFEPQLAQDSAYYFACNRSKASMTVNLRTPEGQDIIRELAQKVDVVVENFPAGTLGRYGLDFNMLAALNPRLVYVSCTGFGQSGPYAQKKGYDTVFQAMGGLMSLTGEKGGGPVKPGLPVADLTSGLWVAIGILAMLSGREKTGRGAHLDFSMLDGQVSLLTLAAARYFALGEVPARLGTEHPGRVPSATFRCKDGKFAHITASDQHWKPLCAVLNLGEWGLAFSSNELRVQERNEVMQKLAEAISRIGRGDLLRMLDEVEVPIGPVNDVAEILSDPHVRARGLVGSFDYPGVGEFKALALPYKFLGWDNPEIGAPPTLGGDTETILADMLGYSREKIASLKTAGAI